MSLTGALTTIDLIRRIAPHRKKLLLGFAALGSVAATLFLLLPSTSPVWYISALLAMSANVGFGASVVAMNAYIPSLAQEAPEVVEIMSRLHALVDGPNADAEGDFDGNTENATEPLLPRSTPSDVERKHELEAEYQVELSRATSRISSLGIALGYGAGICLLIVALIPVTKLGGSTFSLRLAIGLSGIWWAMFTIPAALWLPSTRPITLSSPRHSEQRDTESQEWNSCHEIVAAWVRLGNMLRWREIKKLRNTFKYLAAWFLLSDGRYQPKLSRPTSILTCPQVLPLSRLPQYCSAKPRSTCHHLRLFLLAC